MTRQGAPQRRTPLWAAGAAPGFLAGLDAPVPCASDPELFFDTDPAAAVAAAGVCAGCPVLASCRAHGIAHPSLHGVWGGLSPGERREVRRRRRADQLGG